jgi:long-chain acyl-CoA synthetase
MQTNTHLARLIHDQAKKYGDREVLIYKDFGEKEWKSYSWNQFSQTVKVVSNALLNLGVKVQENVGVFSQNSIQYLFCDFGAWGIRAVTIPFYATSSEQQIQFMISDAKVRFLFVGEQDQYDKARRVFSTCQTLERIIIFDKGVRISEQDANATAVIAKARTNDRRECFMGLCFLVFINCFSCTKCLLVRFKILFFQEREQNPFSITLPSYFLQIYNI